MDNNSPIIILGAPRSGTTYIGNLLSKHSELFYAEEYRFTWLFGNELKSDILSPIHARENVKTYIKDKFEELTKSNGKNRLLEKTPSNALRPFFVHEIYPNAKFIYIHRDPSECILSIRDLWLKKADGLSNVTKHNYYRRWKDLNPKQYLYMMPEVIRRILPKFGSSKINNLWGPRIPGMKQMLEKVGLLETCCMQWDFCSRELEHFYTKLGPKKVLKIKLEDLNEESLKNICKFCDIDVEELIEIFKATYKVNPSGARLQKISVEEREIIKKWCTANKIIS